jgi:hypothetical protein
LSSWSRFPRYQRRRDLFSCFALSDSFSTVPRASSPVSCFVLPNTFSAVPRAPGPNFLFCTPEDVFAVRRASVLAFMFCAPRLVLDDFEGVASRFMFSAPGLIFGGTEGVGSHFHVLRSRARFRRCGGRRVPFSCFALSDSCSAVPRVSCPVFMFCAPGLVFSGAECVESCFLILRVRTRFRRYRGRPIPFSYFPLPDMFSAVPRASGPVFIFSTNGLIFGGKGVRSRFHLFHSRTCFLSNRGCRLPFSYFAFPDSFSAVPRASSLVFIFCAPGIIFGETEVVGSPFHVLSPRIRFRRYRGRQLSFSCSARPDSFSAGWRVLSPVFMFCAPGLVFNGTDGSHFMFCASGPVFGGTMGIRSRFHILRSRTHFRQYRGLRIPFSCLTRPDMFLAVRRA